MANLGITTELNHSHSVVCVGLKPAFRDKMMKGTSVLLWDAFQQAITLEKIQIPIKVNL
jgi:hypothetical protein